MPVCPSLLESTEAAKNIYGNTAAQPASSTEHWLRLGFYNIGWLSASKKAHHTQESLAQEIGVMVQGLALDAVGISEVYNLKEDDKRDERKVLSWNIFCHHSTAVLHGLLPLLG